MIQFCVMGGHDGKIRPNKKVFVTLMGACDVYRPTLARQILESRQNGTKPGQHQSWQFFLTIMGVTDINSPTLAEEFVDLHELLRQGVITPRDVDQAVGEMAHLGPSVSSFTIMGGFSEVEVPDEEAEVESLALQQHIGNISARVAEVLQLGIGKKDGERRSTIRNAIRTAVAA